MSPLYRTHTEPHAELAPTAPVTAAPEATTAEATAPANAAPEAAADVASPAPHQPAPPARVPRTRTGAAWVALTAATLLAVLLIIFLVQNTRSTEISFLWMTTNTPLAVALLIAAVGSVLLTLVIGTARITQLRRQVRKHRN